jgi:hypothetical protein
MDTNQIPFLKKDAVIPIEVGTGFVEKLNELFYYLIKDKSADDVERFKSVYENKEVPEDWMKALEPVNTLLVNIYKKAEELGFIEMKSIEPGTI